MTRAASCLVGLVLLMSLLGASAAARPVPSNEREAERLYRQGEERFRAGRVETAIESFEAGYALAPLPEFLLNLAQCYRALGRRTEAIERLTLFIERASDHPLRAAAERTLEELRAAERADRRNPEPVVVEPPKPSASARAAEPSAVTITAPLPPPPHRRRLRPAAWIGIGLGAAAVITGVALGVYYGTRGGSSDLGTLHVPPP